MISVFIIRGPLIVAARTSLFPLRRLGVLADDMLMVVISVVREEFIRWLRHSATYMAYQLKDDIVSVGTQSSSFGHRKGVLFSGAPRAI